MIKKKRCTDVYFLISNHVNVMYKTSNKLIVDFFILFCGTQTHKHK